MAVNHPDDQQIQMYLDHNLQTDKSDIESHISTCEDCRQKLNEYKEVYQVLQNDPYPQLSSNFSRNIMEKLQIKNTFWALYNEYLLSGLAIFIAIVAMMIWFKPWGVIKSIFTTLGSQISVFITSLSPILGGKIHLILGICLILVIIEIIDYKILRPRFRHMNG
jgi:predicted anti-sigma-YlaC factor YlaD